MRIISWNILHRQYEIRYNPRSTILNNTEEYRINQIIGKLIYHMDNSITETSVVIACLQEVSRDFLTSLEETLKGSVYRIFSYMISDDEYLVTVTNISDMEISDAYKNNMCHGLVILTSSDIDVINCHLKPQHCCSTNIVKYLSNLPVPEKKYTFIAGDYNEKYSIIMKGISDTALFLPYYGKTYNRKGIDHIMFQSTVEVKYLTSTIDRDNLSDHNGIILNIMD